MLSPTVSPLIFPRLYFLFIFKYLPYFFSSPTISTNTPPYMNQHTQNNYFNSAYIGLYLYNT